MRAVLIGVAGMLLFTAGGRAQVVRLLAQAAGALSVEQEYQALLAEDDAAHEEVDRWIQDNRRFAEKGAGVDEGVLNGRIRARLERVRDKYEIFLRSHPAHSDARLAFASFLIGLQEHEAGLAQMEKVREMDPTNAVMWNNLATYYGHNSPVTKAFDCYAKAIEFDPTESLYYHNFATTVYLFRRDATNHFKISEQEVFEKAMKLYHRAQELDPGNFILASDVAQTYYGIRLPKELTGEALTRAKVELADKAIQAWKVALKLARDDTERQGVSVHIARNHINAGRYQAAEEELSGVTSEMFDKTKRMLRARIERRD